MGGAVLLREVDRRLQLIERLAGCFEDHRDPERIEHSVRELLAQRLYAIALGYEDLNDHDELRRDPLLALLAGKQDVTGQDRKRRRDRGQALAGPSTLHRLERTTDGADRHKKIVCEFERVDELLVALYLEASGKPPQQIVLDLDVTDTPLHGEQEGRFFHGYYGYYCYLPLYIFAGQHLLCARQREANQDAAAGSQQEVERIVERIRRAWPKVRIILRADSGFCREELMAWCEANRVDYVFGLARNERLRAQIEQAIAEAAEQLCATGKAARVFCEFRYQTRESWSRARRVVAKAEQLEGKENPRYVVTSLRAKQWPAQKTVRRALLRPRRDGESHQGTVEFVRRPHEQRDVQGQSTALVFLIVGLHAAAGTAAVGVAGHGLGAGTDGDDPAAAVENRRADEGVGAAGMVVVCRELALPGRVRASLAGPALAATPNCLTTQHKPQNGPRRSSMDKCFFL